ncbi:RsbR, positive regulator of sigma-B [Rhodovastum atsumiense]|uniref:STAS domain-containing protein n=1 Tax=Rhodovastum atsumiense TaxID=504468 RepID=A0A5M6ITV6_9PROT|nr:STAS domain-containing protein [Rhodovastum atsumiense]KAA5611746.1 STAS domain-containing protein [Rhodovastum atsumiense]CAH2604328.1 RsbR, positive regulator of sigma-B [Rhodovastum atsumiense]
MSQASPSDLATLIAAHEPDILAHWLDLLRQQGALQSGRLREGELQAQCRTVLHRLATALAAAGTDAAAPDYAPLRDSLTEISRSRALQGFSGAETAIFVFSLKQPVFATIERNRGDARMVWDITQVIDTLGLHAFEIYQRNREEIIVRQQQEIAELSTPVVKLWDGVLALPLIGTLDSQRTQVVMENLLQSIVDHSAEIAIIDITGVPTVDTLVAQHLLKTVAAARLMGADCIVSGIRPQIAQTMVHLGVELNVVSKATLADALALALRRIGREVIASAPRA